MRDLDILMELRRSRSLDSEKLVSDVEITSKDLDSSELAAGRSRRRILGRKRFEDSIEALTSRIVRHEGLQSVVNSVEMEDRSGRPLDRRRFGTSRQLRPLRQGGIGGVAYDDIYLAIGVAATALFIIETLYKTYQLYNSAGRSLADSYLDLVEVWPLPS